MMSSDLQINERRIKFVKDMYKYYSHHAVLRKLYTWWGKNELLSMAEYWYVYVNVLWLVCISNILLLFLFFNQIMLYISVSVCP